MQLYRKRYELLQLISTKWLLSVAMRCYNPASGMSCCNYRRDLTINAIALQYRKRYELLQHGQCVMGDHRNKNVTIPQAVWAVATQIELCFCGTYPSAVTIPQAVWAVATWLLCCCWFNLATCYNTASGMSCCNSCFKERQETLARLQYRKRYELLQPFVVWSLEKKSRGCYNTASGMSCCNVGNYTIEKVPFTPVTIPQAVWAVATGMDFETKILGMTEVTIPQAVWAVATFKW